MCTVELSYGSSLPILHCEICATPLRVVAILSPSCTGPFFQLIALLFCYAFTLFDFGGHKSAWGNTKRVQSAHTPLDLTEVYTCKGDSVKLLSCVWPILRN